jgi:uncharacterized protein (TIGR03083 family)
MAIDLGVAYRETHDDLVALVRDLDEGTLNSMVPSTPAWSVRDVVAHLSGMARDVSLGEAPEVFATMIVDRSKLILADLHTVRQVADRSELLLEELLAEWAGHADALVPMLSGERPLPVSAPFADRMVVTDAVTHAQDVRNGVGRPGERESAAVSVAFISFAGGLGMRLGSLGMPALRLAYGRKERVVGDGAPAATVEAERYELYRAIAGRRSRRQIRSFRWTGDPEPYLPVFPAYAERVVDLVE